MSGQKGDISGIASVISSITSDPEMMDRLRAAVKGGGGAAPEDGGRTEGYPDGPAASAEPEPSALVRTSGPSWSGGDRRRLLEALRPFLSAERREKADSLINLIALLDSGLIDVITKGGR